jgi:hypothetical protein
MQANRWYTQGLKGILLCRDRCDSVEPNAIGVPDSAPRLTTAFDAVDHCYGAGRRPFRSALTSVSGRAAFWFGDSPTFRVRNRTRGGSHPCVGRTRPSPPPLLGFLLTPQLPFHSSPRFSPYSSVASPLISSVASPLISSVASPLLSRLHSSPHHPPPPPRFNWNGETVGRGAVVSSRDGRSGSVGDVLSCRTSVDHREIRQTS